MKVISHRSADTEGLPAQFLLAIAAVLNALALLFSCTRADDDVEQHGSGLTRRAERLLGVDPVAPSNPLVLIPVATGEEPFTLTYRVPVRTDVRSNHCELVLLDNGVPADWYVFTRETNAYTLDWATSFASFGPHALQVQLRIPFHTNVNGPVRLENVTNLVRFDPSVSSFGSRVWIHAFLRVPSADYLIEFYDTNKALLKTIKGHTEKGLIDEVWNLKTTDGKERMDRQIDAQVYVTPTVRTPEGRTRSNAPTVRVPYP